MSQLLRDVDELDAAAGPKTAEPEPTTPADPSPAAQGEIVSLRDLLVRVVKGWKIVLAVVVLSVALSTYSLMNAAHIYTVRMVIAPVGSQALNASSVQGSLSSKLAAFGLPVSGGRDAGLERFLQVMKSVRLAERMQVKYGLLQTIWKGSWDAENKKWLSPQYGWVGSLKNRVVEAFGLPTWAPPSTVSLAGYLGSIGNEMLDGDMRSLVFRHDDPDFGIWLLNSVFTETDSMMREEATIWNERKIEYLQNKLQGVTIQEYRQTLLALVAKEERGRMLLQSDLPFTVDVMDAPYASPMPTSPRPLRSLILSLIGGLIVGAVLALFIDAMRARPARVRS